MRATEVLQRCLADALEPMHALRERVLLKAVEALAAGWRLTLIDLARRWPGAVRVRAPLKALDRLLSNRRLHAECLSLHASMARWLLRGPRPLIVIDWSDLKADKSWCLPKQGSECTFHERPKKPYSDPVFAGRLISVVRPRK